MKFQLARALFLILSVALVAREAAAFPEMVRHGYPNCVTCHVSPNGGGTLTQYGRSLSQELLSTWGTKNEARWLYFVEPPKWLDLGGDVRTVQTYKDTATERSGQFIFMQADVEAAATVGSFTADASLGKQYFPDNSPPHSFIHNFLSRRHYLMYRATDKINVRAGKFMQAFGINTPDHVIVTKRNLGWDEGSESYNLEASYIGEKWDAFVTGNFGQVDSDSEKGISLRSSYALKDTYKLGASYFFGTSPTFSRHVFGPYFILGFTPHFFLLTEADFQRGAPKNVPGDPSSFGWVTYNRLDYEWTQGLHTFVTAELTKLDFSNPNSSGNAFGGGIQWFPRPHFEAQVAYQKRKASANTDAYDYAFLMLHFYP